LQGGWGREPLATVTDLAEHPGGEAYVQPGPAQEDLAVRVGSVALEQRAQALLPGGAVLAEQEQLSGGEPNRAGPGLSQVRWGDQDVGVQRRVDAGRSRSGTGMALRLEERGELRLGP
jgi:hypothetical protein